MNAGVLNQSMSYTILGSARSPFVRINRIFMMHNSIPFEFKLLNFLDDPKHAAELAKESPINRVPILLVDGEKIFDSRVITNYLIKKHNLKPLSIDDENRVSVVYSCLDTALTLFQMKKDGYDINQPGFFISRHRERIPQNLKYLDSWIKELSPSKKEDWNYASIALYSFLFWAHAREIFDVHSYPTAQKFIERFANCTGVQETTFSYK